MKGKYNKNTVALLLLIFPIAVFAKIYQYKFTGGANFGIMNYILNIMNTGEFLGMNSYDFPAKVYSMFNFLGFQTQLEWSIFFTAIFNIIIFIFLLKYKNYTIKEYLFIYASMFILSWTVMNLNKDLIQLMFLLIIYVICSNKNISNRNKIIISAIIFFIESLVFRDYYIIVSGLLIIVYFILSKELSDSTKKKIITSLIKIFAIFFIVVFCYKFISFSSYDKLINRRESLEERDDVNTIIQNMVPGEGYGSFVLNYLINFFRICIPIELLRLGPKQFIFCIYQLMITILLIKSLKNINKDNIVYVTIILAYTIMLTASESDFGTLTRHQSVLLMFYIGMMKNTKKLECHRHEKK